MSERLVSPARFIVDLMEARAAVNVPPNTSIYRSHELVDLHNVHKYQFLNALIAKLQDKYAVKYEDIENEIRSRQVPVK